ncbi:MAG: DEAD/DEAH box helicase, partial [Planctomycetota bacterium]
MLRDRHRLERRLHGLTRRGVPTDEQLAKVLAAADKSAGIADERRGSIPEVTYPHELPVSGKKEEIAEAIRAHQVVVVCGETGSGKTTQLPKICLEARRGVFGTIGHTQPRRLAARTVASRVSQEIGSSELVGHKVRFHDETSPRTLVKLMTDGILLAETQGDRFLNQYDTIIVDEAHERSLNIDFLLGHLRNLIDKRPDLKIVVTSATIDPERFSDHFGGRERCPILEVSGRTYPVEVRYWHLFDPDTSRDREGAERTKSVSDAQAGMSASPTPLPHGRGSWREPQDVNEAIVQAVEELGRDADPDVARGDTLVFLPGEREIREAAKALEDHVGGHHGRYGSFDVLPLYARLSNAEQNRVFAPSG